MCSLFECLILLIDFRSPCIYIHLCCQIGAIYGTRKIFRSLYLHCDPDYLAVAIKVCSLSSYYRLDFMCCIYYMFTELIWG